MPIPPPPETLTVTELYPSALSDEALYVPFCVIFFVTKVAEPPLI